MEFPNQTSAVDKPGSVGPTETQLATLSASQRALVRNNVGLVTVHLRRFVRGASIVRYTRARDDLFQEGCVGLIRAALDYRADRGIPFAAFALPRIRKAISRALLAAVDPRPANPDASGEEGELVARWEDDEKTRRRKRRGGRRLRHADRQRPDADYTGTTIGDRLREKYERAVQRAADFVEQGAASRDDRPALVRELTRERFLVPDDEERRSFRDIARRTRSSFGRVLQCDRRLGDLVRRHLESDPEFAALQRIARTDPDGVDAALDESTDREIGRLGAESLIAEFRCASDKKRAMIMLQLLRYSPGRIEALLQGEIERLPEPTRELLHVASTSLAPSPPNLMESE